MERSRSQKLHPAWQRPPGFEDAARIRPSSQGEALKRGGELTWILVIPSDCGARDSIIFQRARLPVGIASHNTN